MQRTERDREWIRNEVRPLWWRYFWVISILDILFVLAYFFLPNLAWWWSGAIVGSWFIGGYSYKANKFAQPLPDDKKSDPVTSDE